MEAYGLMSLSMGWPKDTLLLMCDERSPALTCFAVSTRAFTQIRIQVVKGVGEP